MPDQCPKQQVAAKESPFLHSTIDLFVIHLPDILLNNAEEMVNSNAFFAQILGDLLDNRSVLHLSVKILFN